MPITASELKLYKSKTVADGSTNGGRMSSNQVISGAVNNVWPHVRSAERIAGSTLLRKLFWKVANDDDLGLLDGKVYLWGITAGDDYLVIFAGGQRDTAGDISGSERKYGAGLLAVDAAAGATSITVDLEAQALKSGADAIFQAGDSIVVSSKTSPDSVTGDTESVVVTTVTPHGTLAQVTLGLASPLASAYTVAAAGKVGSVLAVGDISATVSNWSETSAGGTYNESTYLPVLDHIATVEETWTVTMTSASTFMVSGDSLGSVGSGNIGTDFAPQNADFSRPYFTLESEGWGGAWATGDSIVFQTHPAAAPIWERRTVPAGAAAIASSVAIMVLEGETP